MSIVMRNTAAAGLACVLSFCAPMWVHAASTQTSPASTAEQASALDRTALPLDMPAVVGAQVGKTYKESKPGPLPQPVAAPKGAPNVVVILLDDVGFAA